jgi:RHS repeat-associated protein
VLVAPNFGGGLLVNGPNNNNTTVLTRVDLHDGSYYVFNYSNAFAQVNRVNHYASDGRLREYTSYNLSQAAGQIDCPRFSERRDWAENWNNGNEAVTTYSGDSTYTQETAPDGTIYKEFFATSGWQSGLTTSTEIWSGGVKKKWTTIAWTQDNTALVYQSNARITETNIYDAEGNRRRGTTTYTTFTMPSGTSCSLPSDVYEYAANGTTVLRRTHTDYRYDSAYLNRRIIGLPALAWVYDGSGTLVRKTWFDYDWPASSAHLVATPTNAVQHDSTYDINFAAGRGNLVHMLRYDVTDPDNTSRAMEFKFGYDTNGSVSFTRDHLWHQTNFNYQDSFSDGNNSRNTFAYQTTITDPDGFATTMQHNYDFGALTRRQGPPPAGQTQGLIKTIAYDNAGRVDRVTIGNNGAYTRYVHGPYYEQTFSSINTVADEAYACQMLDGAGRVYAQSSNNPGSTGGYIGQLTTYDIMGRPIQQTKPTEISGGWTPAGDDASWVYTAHAYDWKGRPTVTTLPDGATRENLYGGCGCAGGEVTTVRDEQGRRRRLTLDVLDRLQKVEELNWDQTVYSTTTYTYNARDQITEINQAGQLRSFIYDGHGRLQRRTTPEQGATDYTYFVNDSLQTVTDARGATTTFSYNNRDLVTSLTFGVPSGVAATPNVTFGYDAAGNRTSMTDGLGSVSYGYDQLSRLTSETRTFTGVGTYALSYGYNLANELTTITNPWGAQVSYNYDQLGRASSVSGSGFAGVSSYVNSLSYRAFGVKQINYANGRSLSLGYDNRMRLASWSIPGVLRLQYQHGWEATNRVEFARNLDDETLDRWFTYDHVGRLVISRSGNEARLAFGEQVPLLYNGPYSQGYSYDQWGNMTSRDGWGGDNAANTATYTGNKRNGLTYDAAGNLINDGGQNFTYDATGQAATGSYSGYLLQHFYDGTGLRVKKIDNGTVSYYLRSSVLGGQVVVEINSGGTWQRGYVYLQGQLLAVQQASAVWWTHHDPFVKSQRVTDSAGNVVSTIEMDPWGGNTNRDSNGAFQPRKFTTYERDNNSSDEAMFRRYNRWWSRFDQPDPFEGSYDLTNPQSFNRYAYTQNDPVNLVDPTGLFTNCGQNGLPPCEPD